MDHLAHNHRILLVDDSVEFAKLFEREVMRLGHDVRAVHDGTQGIEAALEFRPDVVLIDIGQSGLDGYEVT